jgi:Domain of unknown function (DUF1996)
MSRWTGRRRWLLVCVASFGVGPAFRAIEGIRQPDTTSFQGASPAVVPVWEGERLPSVAFVVTCKRSHQLADDPILFPGKSGASHLHSFYGNITTKADSDLESMLTGATSCDESLDSAAYWVPSPAPDIMRAYYDAGSADPSTVVAYWPGMKAIAGDPQVSEPGVKIAAFRCGEVGDGPDATRWFASPPSRCSSGQPIVRYTFGQCESVDDQRLAECAPGDAPRYVRLRLLMQFKGFAHSLGPHADFWNTWDQDQLEKLVAVCVRGERKSNLQIKQCRLPGTGPAIG